MLRSTVKPFGLVALVEAGGVDAFGLSPAELAIMASSHSGEDQHVRTIQALYRRAGVSQTVLACGAEGMPLDALTAARLARDGERPSPLRHMCSGQHSVFILLSRLRNWPLETYWHADHPAHEAYRSAVARRLRGRAGQPADGDRRLRRPDLRVHPDRGGPGLRAAGGPVRPRRAATRAAELAPHLTIIRDAMLANPEMIGGSRERLDTSLMKALPGRIVSKSGMEALRGMAHPAGPARQRLERRADRARDQDRGRRRLRARVVGGHGRGAPPGGRARRPAAARAGPLPPAGDSLDPHGRAAAEAIADFDLAPVGELFA